MLVFCYNVGSYLKLGFSRDICREVFWAVVSENEEIFGSGYNLIYDDCHLLFSSNRLKSEGPTTELLLWPEPRPNFTVLSLMTHFI